MSITIALCDDDVRQLHHLRGLLAEWAGDKPFTVNIREYDSGQGFLFHYPDTPCDLLLLDIEMRGLSGMELARSLREQGDMLPIIFITGYSEYISEGYDVEALHYLLKPLDQGKLFAVLDKYVSRHRKAGREILITGSGCSTHVPVDCIEYIEAFGRRTQVHRSDGTVLDCDRGIGQFEGIPGLIHCHRSYLVNLLHIHSISRISVSLDTGGEIPLSRRLFHEVNQAFIAYYKGD